MTQIQTRDTTSARGERRVSQGIVTLEAANLVKGFNFNIRSSLGAVLFKACTVETATEVILGSVTPINDVKAVNDATQFFLTVHCSNQLRDRRK